MANSILDQYGKPMTQATKPRVNHAVQAKYDAAQTTTDNVRHWSNADELSADASNSLSVRKYLRKRARYEVANNCYARGITQTVANDTVGVGPRLQLLTPDSKANSTFEALFMGWARQIHLASKLRTMAKARICDGEAFALWVTNPRLSGPVKLDLKLIECDQVTTPDLAFDATNAVDGIEFDAFGNPFKYHVLREHPGSDSIIGSTKYDRIVADHVIHLFREGRPGQHRGVPEITPALPLFAQLRRFTLAVLAAAETAADFAAVLEATAAGSSDDYDEDDDFNVMALEKRMMTTLPAGYKLGQIRAEQPSTTYQMFKREIVTEIARCMSIPYNIAACDSSDYNYASGRLDHQTYDMQIGVDRSEIDVIALDSALYQFTREASLVEGFLPQTFRVINPSMPHRYFWPRRPHVDPLKEANAARVLKDADLLNYDTFYASNGQDWETQRLQRYRERQFDIEQEKKLPQPATQEEPAK